MPEDGGSLKLTVVYFINVFIKWIKFNYVRMFMILNLVMVDEIYEAVLLAPDNDGVQNA